ncbi:MAG: bifunctional demethylmenaquinone methyltransferase/2-methoxy-6-polyprenyl-1,4-benzoquinol methylase [Ignavibacteria bacterium GWA2_35_8]|nr:MAG: bifunctional demethylmenaquinone methyltransferase/2-methoxy-6-polyprenyl-1,4-benzoquinol methylase [Ignavibacteria bacterium GWA2_35_8]
MQIKNQTENSGKKEFVSNMFNEIAPNYDKANHILSLGIHKSWRTRLVKELSIFKPQNVLDIATGTADVAIAVSALNPKSITGIDNSEEMLKVGRKKLSKLGLDNLISLKYADSENLPFDNNFFDSATVAFGVRNFENLDKGLAEIYRVLAKNSPIIVLEFTNSNSPVFKGIYNFYFKNILPFFGKMITGSKYAYNYLPDSVEAFPGRNDFLQHLTKVGFSNCKFIELTNGVACIYIGIK